MRKNPAWLDVKIDDTLRGAALWLHNSRPSAPTKVTKDTKAAEQAAASA
jgi:hypothetical protein